MPKDGDGLLRPSRNYHRPSTLRSTIQQQVDQALREIDAVKLYTEDKLSSDRIAGMACVSPHRVVKWLDDQGVKLRAWRKKPCN